MDWGIVEVVRTQQDLPDVFPLEPLDPRVADDVLRVVNSEETKMEVACLKNGGRQDAQANDARIQLPWAKQYRVVPRNIGFVLGRFIVLFVSTRMAVSLN